MFVYKSVVAAVKNETELIPQKGRPKLLDSREKCRITVRDKNIRTVREKKKICILYIRKFQIISWREVDVIVHYC